MTACKRITPLAYANSSTEPRGFTLHTRASGSTIYPMESAPAYKTSRCTVCDRTTSRLVVARCGSCFVHQKCAGGTCPCGETVDILAIQSSDCFRCGAHNGDGICETCTKRALSLFQNKLKQMGEIAEKEALLLLQRSLLDLRIPLGAITAEIAARVYAACLRQPAVVATESGGSKHIFVSLTKHLAYERQPVEAFFTEHAPRGAHHLIDDFKCFCRTSSAIQWIEGGAIRKPTPYRTYDAAGLCRLVRSSQTKAFNIKDLIQEYDGCASDIRRGIETGLFFQVLPDFIAWRGKKPQLPPSQQVQKRWEKILRCGRKTRRTKRKNTPTGTASAKRRRIPEPAAARAP